MTDCRLCISWSRSSVYTRRMKLSLEKYIKRRLFDDADYVSDGRKKDTHVSMYIGWQALGPLKYGYITGEEKYKLKDQSQNIYLPSYRKEYISAFDLSKIVTPMATGRSRSISFLMNVAKSVSSSKIATLLRKGLPRASSCPSRVVMILVSVCDSTLSIIFPIISTYYSRTKNFWKIFTKNRVYDQFVDGHQ